MKVCAYVCDQYAKPTYSHESHDVRAWPGFEMVLDAARRAGYSIDYAGQATVHKYDVVLFSVTSDCDWWTFITERVNWKPGRYTVIVGGAGVLNVRPFLQWVDGFVLGRGENILPALLKELEAGNRLIHESVIWADSFDVNHRYRIAQAETVYPHAFKLTNGKEFQESAIGCPNKCFFCGYTWQRRYIGDGSFSAGADSMSGGNRERTIIDLLKEPVEKWQETGPLRIVGLDGTSERLRFAANKRISRDMWREFLTRLATIGKPHQVKVYNIVGYPGETEDDWREFVEDVKMVDAKLTAEKQWSLLCHFTPFRAMPATPTATWPMSKTNYRGKIAATLKTAKMPGNVFYQGARFWAVEGMGTDSLASVMLSAICLRGTEADSEAVARVACARRFWTAPAWQRQTTLEAQFDIDRLFRAFTADDLPTQYLTSYRPYLKARHA